MTSRIHFAIIFVVLGCFFSCTNAQFRVIKGVLIKIEKSPHSVSIFRCSAYRCVGSLVTLESVVTVAHCVSGVPEIELDVLAGVADIRKINTGIGQQLKVKSVIKDPDYCPEPPYMDIAVVKVDGSFRKTLAVQPISLCDCGLKPDRDLQVSGWGSPNLYDFPNPLLITAKLPIMQKVECQKLYDEFEPPVTLPNTIICAGSSRGNLRCGDSGAGAVVNNKLFAVANGGADDVNAPSLFTDVTNEKVRKFLESNMY